MSQGARHDEQASEAEQRLGATQCVWPGERLASRLAPVPTGPVGRAEVFGLFLKDNRNLLRDQAGVKTGV